MILETFQLLSPELILLLTGLTVLIVDLFWRGGAAVSDEVSSREEVPANDAKTIWIPTIALVGLGAALVATILLLDTPPTVVLGMMAVDPFALFFKIDKALHIHKRKLVIDMHGLFVLNQLLF